MFSLLPPIAFQMCQTIAENQEALKSNYAAAKALAVDVNAARDRINELKELIAQLRVEHAAQGLVGTIATGISVHQSRMNVSVRR
jgi:hypothetical protein